jgi:hypothetical protein
MSDVQPERSNAERDIETFLRGKPPAEQREWQYYLARSKDEALLALRAILTITDTERLQDLQRRNERG